MLGNSGMNNEEARSLVNNSIYCNHFYVLLTSKGSVILMLEDENGNTYSGEMDVAQFIEQVKPVLNMVQ